MQHAVETGHLYERIAELVAAMIARGTLRAGDRLPSVRRLSRQQSVSVSTVLQAYLLLEARGVIEARPQSGHYVRRRDLELCPEPRPPRPCSTATRVSVKDQIARVLGAMRDPDIVPLGAATPSPALLPTEKLNRTLALVARSAGGAGVSYDPPPGCLALRRQIARRSAEWGCALGPDDFLTTVGAMEALNLALRAVTRPGDTVAVESPTYYGHLQLLESLSLKVVEIPSHARTGIDLEALDEALRAQRLRACLATPNFNNPTGSLMDDEAKERLVALLARRGVPLVEDDIYGDVFFGEARPRPAKAFDREGGVLLCSSFTKTLAPGYRVGWIAPGRWREQVEHLKFANTVATPTLPQMAIAEFLRTGGYDHHLRSMRRRLAAQLAQFREAVAEHFPPGTRVSRPQGGFVLWVELPPGSSADLLQERALERGVSIAPGTIFTAKPRYASFVRISCGHPWTEVMARSIRTVGRLAAELG